MIFQQKILGATHIPEQFNHFFSSGGAGAVPSGGGHKSLRLLPSGSLPAGWHAVIPNFYSAQVANLLAHSGSERP